MEVCGQTETMKLLQEIFPAITSLSQFVHKLPSTYYVPFIVVTVPTLLLTVPLYSRNLDNLRYLPGTPSH